MKRTVCDFCKVEKTDANTFSQDGWGNLRVAWPEPSPTGKLTGDVLTIDNPPHKQTNFDLCPKCVERVLLSRT